MNILGEAEGSEIVKPVDEMLDDSSNEPMRSLVAETVVELVGHFLLTSAIIEQNHRQVSTKILAPLAVVQNRRHKSLLFEF